MRIPHKFLYGIVKWLIIFLMFKIQEVKKMPNYKEMYLTLFRASEKAVNIIIEAQKEVEELYINSSEPEIFIISTNNNNDK